MIAKIVVACIIAIVVGLVLSALLGPLLVAMHVPPAVVVGGFFTSYGWVIGILAGIWYFFTNGNLFNRVP